MFAYENVDSSSFCQFVLLILSQNVSLLKRLKFSKFTKITKLLNYIKFQMDDKKYSSEKDRLYQNLFSPVKKIYPNLLSEDAQQKTV